MSAVKISHWLEKPYNLDTDPVQLLGTYGSWNAVPKRVGHSALSLACYYVAAQLQLPDFRAHSISDLRRSRRLNAINQYTPIIPDQGLVFLHTERSTYLHDSDSLLVAPIAVGGTVPWIVVPNEETQEFEMEQIDSVREKYGYGTIAVIATLSGTRRSSAA